MSKFIDYLSGRFDWRYRPGRSVVKGSNKPKQETTRDSDFTKSNQRETTVTRTFKCPVEPFRETLRILDEIL